MQGGEALWQHGAGQHGVALALARDACRHAATLQQQVAGGSTLRSQHHRLKMHCSRCTGTAPGTASAMLRSAT